MGWGGRWRRFGLVAAGFVVASGGALAAAIELDPDFGPWLADTGRSVVGPEAVAWGEEVYYGAQDRWLQWWDADAPPAELWETTVPAPQPVAVAAVAPVTVDVAPIVSAQAVPVPRRFIPRNFKPPVAEMAAPGDGVWTAWQAGPKGAPSAMYRTTVHPDPERSRAVVAVVAMDLGALELHAVPGTVEPKGEAPASLRTGLVPKADQSRLVAAFNGGWQSVHGQYGMKVGGTEILPPRQWGCTIAGMADGTVRITGWKNLEKQADSLRWFRQTPPCTVDGGVHDHLLSNPGRRWGTALGGETVVRRSAIALDASRKVLYYAMGDALTADTLTTALESAGAASAAILDINYSFPRFLTYRPDEAVEGLDAADRLAEKPVPPAGIYVSKPSGKDFFYVTLRDPS